MNDTIAVINNEFDYSNSLPTIDYVSYLIKYMYDTYQQLIELANQDEERNKQYKQEYQTWNYKKTFGARFEIYIREKTYNNITCNDYASFVSAVDDGNLKEVTSVSIKMELDFKRGHGVSLVGHENSFYVSFEPFNIKFARKSNNKDQDMDQIEANIKKILEGFPKCNTIFYTK